MKTNSESRVPWVNMLAILKPLGRRKWCRPGMRQWLPAVAGIALGSQASAVTISWNASSGNWSETLKWNPQQAPTISDNVYVNNGGTVQITSGARYAEDLDLGSSGGQSGQVTMTGGALYVRYHQTIGGGLSKAALPLRESNLLSHARQSWWFY